MTVKYQAPTVKKAFSILNQIAAQKKGQRVSELAYCLNISKSTVHGILTALDELGAVIRDPLTKRYSLGLTLFELGRAAYSRADLKDTARPFMEKLMITVGESSFLGVKNGDHVTILDIVESSQNLKITAPLGTAIPLLAGAIGKVMLAQMEPEDAAALINGKALPHFTANTITDSQQYLKEVASVKKDGYAIDNEEYIPGVKAIAAPLHSIDRMMAAIWVVGFKPGMDDRKIKFIATEIKRTAEAIRKKTDREM
ncbi:IclR family transcriptional regulator [Desulfococcaceae bacterium HSG7]|nr:IclR family transcriptional regulator [Desulfococcaceae bacterium HSG7]